MGAAVAPTRATKFGKYTLVAKLATGGMAEIFLARLAGAAGFEKLVCIKRILPALAKDKTLVGMFLAEAKIAAQISHHNVCQVFELGEIDGQYFIAMEYLEGVPLSGFRRPDLYGPPIDPRLVAGLGLQACEGLHHAHQLKRPDGTLLGVVHRDVSASNLFATVDGVVKVLDFGIAKIQDPSVRTTTGSVKGTYAYMAPEQLRGQPLDRRTDVFALGIVLWELFGRRHLFKRETEYLTFQAITSDPIPDVAELRPDVPPALAQVIARALSRDVEGRYPTARAMGEALMASVATLGGPLTASAIGDEVTAAFDAHLTTQRRLIRIAREGGVLDLDEELGPAIGHGTQMITTPVSMITGAGTLVSTGAGDGHADAAPRAPRSWRRVVLIAALLVAVAIVAVVLARRGDDPVVAAGAPSAATTGPAAPVEVPVETPVEAPVDAHVVGAREVADAAIVDPPPPDAAEVVAAVGVPADAGAPTRTRPARPAGPPGFITIDAAPEYAVIHIDGKAYGETPLVRLELPPGRHVVRAVSPSGATRTRSIMIPSGKVAPTLRIKW